jgi:RimJ/RimL family protein N-acetyltransferase
MNNDVYLRRFYDILGECGTARPPWEQWREFARENAEVWPIMGNLPAGVAQPHGMPAGRLMIGGVLFKGHSIHLAVLPEWRGRWIRPSMLKAWRKHYQHDCDLYATPDIDNKAARALAERLGFRLQRTLGQSAIYVKERTACLQP